MSNIARHTYIYKGNKYLGRLFVSTTREKYFILVHLNVQENSLFYVDKAPKCKKVVVDLKKFVI